MFANAAGPLSYFLLSPFNPAAFEDPSLACLSNSFHGIYGGQSLFKLDESCMPFGPNAKLESGSLLAASVDTQHQLVWLQEAAIDDSLRTEEEAALVAAFFDSLAVGQLSVHDAHIAGPQEIFVTEAVPVVQLLHQTASSALVSADPKILGMIDTILPRFWRSYVVSAEPVSFVSISAESKSRLDGLLEQLKFDPVVSAIVNGISVPQMRKDIAFLTGEDGKSGIVSRHSFAEGSRVAASWLLDRFEETGATCELKIFMEGYAPNVICRYPSTVETNATVLLSGHYDSRGSFGSERAPGGNDDGSGTTCLLALARAIRKTGITFRSNVELVAFAGEEQGLYGSKAYADELREAGTNLTLMIQADMTAYHAEGEPPQLGIPEPIGTPEVIKYVYGVAAIYSPELKVGQTAACCSDHQPFFENGFPAIQLFERAGPIVDPMYHNSRDLSIRKGYDFYQMKSIAKVQLATLLHAAGYDLPGNEDLTSLADDADER